MMNQSEGRTTIEINQLQCSHCAVSTIRRRIQYYNTNHREEREVAQFDMML